MPRCARIKKKNRCAKKNIDTKKQNKMRRLSLSVAVFVFLWVIVDAANVCFGSLGGSHLSFVSPVIRAMSSRGHNVTVFVASRHLEDARKKGFGDRVSVLSSHYRNPDEEGMPDGMLALCWKVPRPLQHLVMGPMVMGVIQGFMRELPAEEARQLISGCDVVVADAFQPGFADAAAELEIPAVFFHNFITPLIPPQRSSWLLHQVSTLGISGRNSISNPLDYCVFNVAAPFLQTLSHIFWGFRVYGYPRIMWSSVFARPLLLPGPASFLTVSHPPNVIPLGAPVTDMKMRINPYPYRIALPGCKRVDAERIVYAAFGTNVKVPKLQVDKLCAVFRSILDDASSGIDHVVFGFRALDFTPDSCHQVCQDERISTAPWVNQTDILQSGRVAVFVTHGGYSSVWESFSSRTPMCVMPVFGDQPANGDWVTSSEYGDYCDPLLPAEELLSKLLNLIKNRDALVNNMEQGRQLDIATLGPATMEERAAILLEMVIHEGVNNSLQRLVDPVWAPYAKRGGNRMIPTPATYGIFVWLIFLIITIGLICSRCCSCCSRKAPNIVKSRQH